MNEPSADLSRHENLVFVDFRKSGAKVARAPSKAETERALAGGSLSPAPGKDTVAYWRRAVYRRKRRDDTASGDFYARISYRGDRREIKLETGERDAAAQKARELWLRVKGDGWGAVVAPSSPVTAEAAGDDAKGVAESATFGEYLEAFMDRPGISHLTAEDYRRKVLTLVSEVVGIPRPPKKAKLARMKRWRDAVESVRIADLSETQFTNWRNGCLDSIGRGRKCGTLKDRSSAVTVNGLIRAYKAVFKEEQRERLAHLALPDPVPGLRLRLLKQRSARYRGGIDANALLQKADVDLKRTEPEAYKLLVLALAAGLRRSEADLLLWDAFDFENSCIRIERTQFYGLKSTSSEGTVFLQPEVCAFFRSCYERRGGDFVLESTRPPKRHLVNYIYYRANKVQDVLNKWLRENGVDRAKPTHELRKEFGSLINERYGIYEASRSLRHSTVKVTESHYLNSKVKPVAKFDFRG